MSANTTPHETSAIITNRKRNAYSPHTAHTTPLHTTTQLHRAASTPSLFTFRLSSVRERKNAGKFGRRNACDVLPPPTAMRFRNFAFAMQCKETDQWERLAMLSEPTNHRGRIFSPRVSIKLPSGATYSALQHNHGSCESLSVRKLRLFSLR